MPKVPYRRSDMPKTPAEVRNTLIEKIAEDVSDNYTEIVYDMQDTNEAKQVLIDRWKDMLQLD